MSGNRPIWPMVWPWNNGQGDRMHWREAINSRRFSLSYLSIIALLYAWLGFGTSSCSTPSEAIICDMALWPYNLVDAPLTYVLSLFTSIWFHNSIDHILLVTVVITIFLQSAEVRIGTKRTMIAMFAVQISTALIITLYLYMGDSIWVITSTQPMVGIIMASIIAITWVALWGYSVSSACYLRK